MESWRGRVVVGWEPGERVDVDGRVDPARLDFGVEAEVAWDCSGVEEGVELDPAWEANGAGLGRRVGFRFVIFSLGGCLRSLDVEEGGGRCVEEGGGRYVSSGSGVGCFVRLLGKGLLGRQGLGKRKRGEVNENRIRFLMFCCC